MGYPTWYGIMLGYGMGRPPFDTIPLKRFGFGFFVGYPVGWYDYGIVYIPSKISHAVEIC